MPRRRLAVALLVEDPLGREIDGLRRGLGDGALERVSPHCTLVPPINVHTRDLDEVLQLLRDAAAATEGPLQLRLGRVATFAGDSPVAYLEVSGDLTGLRRLRAAVRRGPLERPDVHPFQPHVTVADELDPARLGAAIVSLERFSAPWTPAAVHLLEEGAPGPHRWNPIAWYALEAPALLGTGGHPVVLQVGQDPAVEELLGPLPPEHRQPVSAAARDEQGRLVAAVRSAWVGPVAVAAGAEGDDALFGRLLEAIRASVAGRPPSGGPSSPPD